MSHLKNSLNPPKHLTRCDKGRLFAARMSSGGQKSTQTILGRKKGRRKVISSVVKDVNLPPQASTHQSRPREAQAIPPPQSNAPQSSAITNPRQTFRRQSSLDAQLLFPSSEADYLDDFGFDRPSSPNAELTHVHDLKQVKRVRVSLQEACSK